ncbi:MAG: cobalt-precorrin-5B (C(1))-methyltransferase [Spirochaetia bacterium]|nr:cobalt-precorrin-5B (C(1))-methyltransferase [Spirochaetia bacterium]
MKKVIPKDPAYLRTGYTTGACSAAAAKAAVRALIQEKKMTRIESVLPNGKKVIFPVKRCEIRNQSALCSVVKDAGDDPDCTHLAELTAEVKLNDTGEITLSGGEGVAEVTLPGLGISVGEPSITEIPRKNIIEMVKSELGVTKLGADITISVPDGEERAKKTTNERLGLLGGISILGTSGIVKPYSTAAYRKSIIQSIYVAYEKGIRELAFTTGGKTEFYAMENLKHLRQESFIQVGDFIGTGLRNAFKKGISLIYIFGMIGKLSKMADGVIQTHQKGSDVNMQMLADAALSAGFPEEKVQKILESTTARNVLDLAREENLEKELSCEICRRVVVFMTNYASGIPVSEIKQELIPERTRDFQIRCTLIDFNGEILGEYPEV